MITFRLDGNIAKRFGDFGTELELNVSSVPEAIRLLDTNLKTVGKKFIQALKYMDTAVIVGEDIHDEKNSISLKENMLGLNWKDNTIITLIDCPHGSKDDWWNIVIAVVLVVVSIYVPAAWGFTIGGEFYGIGNMVYNIGISMAISGMLGVLQGSQSMPDAVDMETPEERPSYFINGPKNTVESGHVIPYMFGKYVLLGSNIISTNVITGDIN